MTEISIAQGPSSELHLIQLLLIYCTNTDSHLLYKACPQHRLLRLVSFAVATLHPSPFTLLSSLWISVGRLCASFIEKNDPVKADVPYVITDRYFVIVGLDDDIIFDQIRPVVPFDHEQGSVTND